MLNQEQKEYLEEKLSNIFHDKTTGINEMRLIISILKKCGIDTKKNLMEPDMNFYEADLGEAITKFFNNNI